MKRNRFPLVFKPYIELDYIESTNTQYINTGFKPNQDTKIILDVEGVKTDTTTLMWYGVQDPSKHWMLGKHSASSWDMVWYYGSQTKTIGTWNQATINTRHSIIQDKNNLTVDGVTYSLTYVNFQTVYDLYLFCADYQGKEYHPDSLRMYSCKIYDNGVLIRDYIPVQMKETGEIGLWDKSEKKFYGNAGTGKFKGVKDNMPVDGIILDYIKSTGTQYIDSGYKPNGGTEFEIKVQYETFTNNNYCFGGGYNWANNALYYGAVALSFGTATKTYDKNGISNPRIDKLEHNRFTRGAEVFSFSTQNFTSAYNAYVFGINVGHNGGKELFTGKIYYLKIYDANVLVRDYIPVKLKETEEIGLWDKVHKVFYPNIGTGTFIAGVAV
jgi:hypothetical protein